MKTPPVARSEVRGEGKRSASARVKRSAHADSHVPHAAAGQQKARERRRVSRPRGKLPR